MKQIGKITSNIGDIKIYQDGEEAVIIRPSGQEKRMSMGQLYKFVVFDPV